MGIDHRRFHVTMAQQLLHRFGHGKIDNGLKSANEGIVDVPFEIGQE